MKDIKGRQMKMTWRKAFSIGTETIQRIKKTADIRFSKYSLNIFLLYLTNIMIRLTRFIPIYSQLSIKEELESTTKLTKHKDNIKRKLSSADIVELVSRKPKELTEKMNTVLSEFQFKLNINKSQNKLHDNRRAKSVTKVDEISNNNTLKLFNEINREEREQMKEDIKLATSAAAKRVLGRRRSYHNITDVENEKIDGLTYIAIVESHVYTYKNAIFNDYISHVKKQVNNVLEITDRNDMVATELIAGKSYKFSSNQRELNDVYLNNTEDFLSKEICIDKGQKIEYVATVTVEHKQIPKSINIEKDEKYVEINKLALKKTTEQVTEVNETKNLNEVITPTPIIEEVESTTNIHEATAHQINELCNKVEKQSVEITELKEDLPIVKIEEKELNKLQARGVETIKDIQTALHEIEEENEFITKEVVPIIKEVKKEIISEVDEAVSHFTEASILPVTELKEQTPKITIEEEILSKAQILNKEYIKQTNEVYNEVDIKDEEAYNLLEDKLLLTTEKDNVIASKMVNETYVYEEPILMPQIEIQSVVSALSSTEESHFESALPTSLSVCELTTETNTAVIKDVEVQKEIAITKTEANELDIAQTVAIATARQTSEAYDEVQNQSFNIESNKEFPSSSTENHELKIIQPISCAIASNIDIKLEESEYFDAETKDLQQCSSLEVTEEIIKLYSICYAIIQDIKINLEEIEQLSIDRKDQEVAISSLEEEFKSIQAYCTSVVNDLIINIYEVEDFKTPTIIEEKATEEIEIEIFNKAQSLNTELYQEINIPIDKFEIINIDKDLKEEKAEVSEEENNYSKALITCKEIIETIDVFKEDMKDVIIDKYKEEIPSTQIETEIFTFALAICTSISSEITTISVEVETLPDERFPEEKTDLSEEKNNYFKTLAICKEINQDIDILLEVTNELIINKFEEEMPTTSLEPDIFSTALSICISILSDIIIIYFETELLQQENHQEVKSVISIEEDYYFKALKTCIDISQYIELLLDESNLLIIEQLKEEFPSTSTEPFVLESTLPISTSSFSEINQELHEAINLDIEELVKEEAKILIEVSKLTMILAICIAAIGEIYKDLEECVPFKVKGIKEELGSFIEEPFVLKTTLPMCVSILEHINFSYSNAEVLEMKQLPIENANSTLEVDFVTIFAICTAIVETKITTLDEVNSFKVDKILEYKASEYSEPKIFTKTLPKCTATVLILNVPVFELKLLKPETFEQETVSVSLEIKNLETAEVICQNILKQDEISVNEVETMSLNYELEELNASHNVSNTIEKQIESSGVKIKPKQKNNVSMQEVSVSNEDNTNKIINKRKKKITKAFTMTEDEINILNINQATLEENSDDFESLHIEELKEDDIKNEQVTITEEPIHLMTKETVTIGRKNIKQKVSNAVHQEYNIQSNIINTEEASGTISHTDLKRVSVEAEPIIKNNNELNTSIVLQAKECINNESNVNISIGKAKAKQNETYQEMSYDLTVTKPQVLDEPVFETKEETLYVRRKKDLKYHTEEFEEEFNLNLNQDESGVVIHEITTSDEEIENSINMENRNEAMDDEDASQDVYESSTLVKRRSKGYDSNQESAALTKFRKEDFDEDIENYEEDNLNINMTSAYSRKEYAGDTEIISQTSDFESQSLREDVISKKSVGKRISKTNAQALNIERKKEAHQEITDISNTNLDIKAAKYQIETIKGKTSLKANLTTQENTSLNIQEYDSTIKNKSKLTSLKTNIKRDEIVASQNAEINKSSTDESPTTPPTPLTDEYIFRLVAPLPKSRGTTPVPEPSPVINRDENTVKNLVPNIESVKIERVVYNPPLPTPPTSPVPAYTKPGLNGGMKRLPRYFKPGLRGGSDRPPIPKEEIIEVRKNLSNLTSDINETLKNIEKYKKIVETLKQQKAEGESSTIMEDGTDKQTKPEEVEDTKDAKEKETSQHTIIEKSNNELQPEEIAGTKDANEKETLEQTKTEKPIHEQPIKSTTQQNSETNNSGEINLNNNKTINVDIKHDFANKIEEVRIKGYDIKEVTTFEEIEKEYENTGIVELAPDTAGEESIEKEFNIIKEDLESEQPKAMIQIKIDEEIEQIEDKLDVTSDEEQKAVDDEVARVTGLNADRKTSEEISPVETSPSEADTIKEAHIISLTRVLSSHMLREGLSPDCQKMKDKFENKNLPDVKIKDDDRSWTTFLQKSSNLQTQKLEHFKDLQNKFEKQEPFTTNVTERNELRLSPVIKPKDFNSSPVPWQERAFAGTIDATYIKELTPGDGPQFFLAIPTESKDDGVLKSTVIPLPNLNNEINKLKDDGKSEHTVHEIIQEALMRVESLNIGEGKNRSIEFFLNNIKNITASSIPVADQLSQMRDQLEKLERVPDIIKETLENVMEKLHLINQKKEETLHTKEVKYQKVLEPKVTKAVEVNKKEEPQIIKEETKEAKVVKMAETKGELLVKDKKPFEQQMQKPMAYINRPQQKFGWMKPEPRPIKLFGGRRWRRPGEEYTEEQIAETILANSELIQGKTMGINFMKYEKPPIPLDHLQNSEVYKMIHNTEQTAQKPVELLRTVIAEADYRERCRSLSPCPPESSVEYKSTF
ncbi:hypothetical protein RR46_01313 [Papilio xuthus]|uniref:Uncharacterized protein n=1 Tax=Papilio xuthus TaxID=66420 RepID=A0A0N0PAL3_PAPXU|nr:hypothetical protein RR46_01313 [Papilio xuthus]